MTYAQDLARTARIRLWKHVLKGFEAIVAPGNLESFLIQRGATIVDEFEKAYLEGFDRLGWNDVIEKQVEERSTRLAQETWVDV